MTRMTLQQACMEPDTVYLYRWNPETGRHDTRAFVLGRYVSRENAEERLARLAESLAEGWGKPEYRREFFGEMHYPSPGPIMAPRVVWEDRPIWPGQPIPPLPEGRYLTADEVKASAAYRRRQASAGRQTRALMGRY